MQRFTKEKLTKDRTKFSLRFCGSYTKVVCVLVLGGTMMLVLSGCGTASQQNVNSVVPFSGNWQFTVANPPDQSFLGGLQGGFLLEKSGAVTGSATYSVSLPAPIGGNPTVCNSGSAPITGTINSQNVTLSAVAGAQTFTFTGMLSVDGSTMLGTYTSTAGTAADGSACGSAQTGLQWSATSVPSVTAIFQGSFHSTGGTSGLNNQDFPVTGSLTQAENTGASSVAVTGTVSFIDPTSLKSDYPCIATASVNGQVSGNTVILQIIGSDGSLLGQIGGSVGSGVSTVTLDPTPNGDVLHSLASPGYAVNTNSCAGAGLSNPADSGNICLALRDSTACQQPFTLSPSPLTFAPQALGTTSKAQSITITNISSAILSGLALTFINNSAAANFTVAGDTCDIPGNPLGSSFDIAVAQSCTIKITFTPQASCAFGVPQAQCPSSLAASLTVTSPLSADNDTAFTVPITGSIAASSSKLDFAAEDLWEESLPQLRSGTNCSWHQKQTTLDSRGRTFQDVEQHAEID